MIRLQDVELTLPSAAGPVHILRGLSLDVARGETLSVLGPSGSGKSTLMMIIGGLERPSGGRVSVAGRDLGGLGEDALAIFRRDSLGIVFQDFHLVPTMTALENVAIPLELAGRDDAFARAADWLGAVGLGHRLSHLRLSAFGSSIVNGSTQSTEYAARSDFGHCAMCWARRLRLVACDASSGFLAAYATAFP